ncbi:hypothetical protein [Persicirhabdus sediminis]|uniref:Uncharacterized protein n=1 Tax=Persicirhabdus sediminis TaxID=454144 RepID=A0A8J7MC00_9BACT|nr:hypothetical protein [Persicirhabdus sediminis]MBK1789706.1 hypothetical protein [Persicirhabdus sediminis]
MNFVQRTIHNVFMALVMIAGVVLIAVDAQRATAGAILFIGSLYFIIKQD